MNFIEQFMNQTVYLLANRKELCQAVEKECWMFLKAERGQKKEIISKGCIVSGKVTLLRGTKKSIQRLPTFADQVIPGWQVETANMFGIKS